MFTNSAGSAKRRVIRAKHGSRSMYNYHSCRCVECKEANKIGLGLARAARYMKNVPEGKVHGTSTYNNYGCRCPICVEAYSAKNKAAYIARKAAKVS